MKYLLLALLSLTLLSCSMMAEGDDTPVVNKVNVGDKLPTFTITMHSGAELRSEDLQGKPSLIVFFSTTCSDCQRELPALNARYLQHGTDTTFVAIAREQTDAEVAAYWEAQGLSMPFSAQTDRAVYSLFATSGIPRIYISDANGVVRYTQSH